VAITPQDIETKQFAVALRGFDQKEVTSFLQSVAADYKTALDPVSASEGPAPQAPPASAPDPYATIGEEVASVLRSARDVADETRRRAEEEAETLLNAARQEAAVTVAQAKRDAEDIVSNTRSRFEQLIRDEQELGNRLRSMRGDVESLLSRIPPPPPSTPVSAPAPQ
jgi:cell division initiation protein